MEKPERTEDRWEMFRSEPAAFAHVRRVVDAFGGLIADEIASKLRQEERFRARLSALLVEPHALSDDFGEGAPTDPVRQLASASGAHAEALVRRCGAVYWARALLGQIEATAVVAIKQALGDEAYAIAIAHRDLAGPDINLPPVSQLDAAVTAAGTRCLAAWCALQPPGVAQRVRLMLPVTAELAEPPAGPFEEAGPRIVDRLLASERPA
jgi:hypothetical protein